MRRAQDEPQRQGQRRALLGHLARLGRLGRLGSLGAMTVPALACAEIRLGLDGDLPVSRMTADRPDSAARAPQHHPWSEHEIAAADGRLHYAALGQGPVLLVVPGGPTVIRPGTRRSAVPIRGMPSIPRSTKP